MMKFSDIKYYDFESWFELWFIDSKNILETMHKNMNADINAGYSIAGASIKKQMKDISEYSTYINNALETFKTMNENSIEKWCYYECLRKGIIE